MGLRLEKRPERGPARRPWKRSPKLRREVKASRGIWMRDMIKCGLRCGAKMQA